MVSVDHGDGALEGTAGRRDAVDRLRDLWRSAGAEIGLDGLDRTTPAAEVLAALGAWLGARRGCDESVLVYWTGRALDVGGEPHLLTGSRDHAEGGALASIAVTNLAALVASHPQPKGCHLILDTYNETREVRGFERAVASAIDPGTASGQLGLIASCACLERESGKSLSERIERLLAEGPVGDRGRWTSFDQSIPLAALVNELATDWPASESIEWATWGGTEAANLIANPRFAAPHRCTAPLIEPSGTAFVGRNAIRADLARWLTRRGGGVYVVLGGAGTGKTALLQQVAGYELPQRAP